MTTALVEPGPRDVYRLRAHEIWGGSEAASDHISVFGFDAWVYSIPWSEGGTSGNTSRGGDLRFVSTCAAGQIVRFTLADISGHGEGAGDTAELLRSLIRKHINTPNPTRFARALNLECNRLAERGTFATAIITTYFCPTDHLIVCNAGHPRPLIHRAATREWAYLDERSPGVLAPEQARQTGISNLPLGIIAPANYPLFATPLQPGDLYIAYTDALIEASDGHNRHLGEPGFLDIVRGLDASDPGSLGPRILDAVGRVRAGKPPDDDTTLLVLRHTGTNPPDGVWPRIQALGRLVGLVR